MKAITAVKIREDRALRLKEKAIELAPKRREILNEADLVNWMIDECLDKIDANSEGFFFKLHNQEQ
jgi:hypothetical protein